MLVGLAPLRSPRVVDHAISALSRAICSTDCPLESIRLMIAIDGDMVPRDKNPINRI
jgi:hypothetical protein